MAYTTEAEKKGHLTQLGWEREVRESLEEMMDWLGCCR